MAEGKSAEATRQENTRSRAVKDVTRAGKEVVGKVKQAGQAAALRAAKAGKTVQKRVQQAQKDLAPAAAKAKKGLQQAQKGLGKAFQVTARATRKSARILGIKAQIAAATHALQRLQLQIGEAYLKAQRRKGAAPIEDSTLAALVKSAEAATRKIQQLRAKEKIERAAS